jgi:hypothetical protein
VCLLQKGKVKMLQIRLTASGCIESADRTNVNTDGWFGG